MSKNDPVLRLSTMTVIGTWLATLAAGCWAVLTHAENTYQTQPQAQAEQKRVDEKFDAISKRFDRLDVVLDRMDTKLDAIKAHQ